MKYCNRCKANIAGDRKLCPLCQGELRAEGDSSEEVFPFVPTVYKKYNLFFRLLIFLSIVAGVVSVVINLMFPTEVWWSFFVVAGIICVWISLAVAVKKRRNIPKNIFYQVILLSLIGLLFDWLTGWHGWSLDFVIPISCIAALIALAIVARVLRLRLEDYIVYMLIMGLFTIVPILLLAFGKLRVTLPSTICIGACIISVAGLLIFDGERLLDELKKRLHI